MGTTIKDINKLRVETGVGVLDCKKALIEAGGVFDDAVQILRKKGLKVIASRGANSTNDGRVLCVVNRDKHFGVILSLKCETDFVANSDVFVSFCGTLEEILFECGVQTPEALLLEKCGSYDTINDYLVDVMGKVGEKIVIDDYSYLSGDYLFKYIHSGNRLGTLLKLEAPNYDTANTVGGDVAMHITAMNPISIHRNGVSKSVFDKESEIARERSKGAKTQAIADKMFDGYIEKFYKDSVLLEQVFIKDDKVSVGDYINRTAHGVVVTDFRRVAL